MKSRSLESRLRRTAGNICVFLTGGAVSASAIAKFARIPVVVQKMGVVGFSGRNVTLVAVLEIVSAASFLYRPTRTFGVLLLSAFLGGAVCSHVRVEGYRDAIGPATLLAIAWVGTWLRHPQSLWDSSLEFPSNEHRYSASACDGLTARAQ